MRALAALAALSATSASFPVSFPEKHSQKKVKVSLFYESLCGACRDEIMGSFKNMWDNYQDVSGLTFVIF